MSTVFNVVGIKQKYYNTNFVFRLIQHPPKTSVVSFSFTQETVPKIFLLCRFDNLHTYGKFSYVQQKFSDILWKYNWIF